MEWTAHRPLRSAPSHCRRCRAAGSGLLGVVIRGKPRNGVRRPRRDCTARDVVIVGARERHRRALVHRASRIGDGHRWLRRKRRRHRCAPDRRVARRAIRMADRYRRDGGDGRCTHGCHRNGVRARPRVDRPGTRRARARSSGPPARAITSRVEAGGVRHGRSGRPRSEDRGPRHRVDCPAGLAQLGVLAHLRDVCPDVRGGVRAIRAWRPVRPQPRILTAVGGGGSSAPSASAGSWAES